MRKSQLKTSSTERLIDEFRSLSSRNIRAILEGPLGDANRQYDSLVAIRSELRARGLEAQHQLLALLADPDPGTRYWAATSVLTFAPEEAQRVLAELERTQRNALGFKAGLVLEHWKAGTFNPP